MPSREQLTQERLNGLIEILVENGTISREYADSLEGTCDFGQASETAQAKCEGRGPPDHAGPPEDRGKNDE